MKLLRVSRRKNWRFFPAGSFFLVLCMITYQIALISIKLPCLKNFLVTRLMKDNLCQKITLRYDLSCIYIYFTKKRWSYSLGGKRNTSFSEEYIRIYIFYIFGKDGIFFLQKWCYLSVKKVKMTFHVKYISSIIEKDHTYPRKYGISSDRNIKDDKKVYSVKCTNDKTAWLMKVVLWMNL